MDENQDDAVKDPAKEAFRLRWDRALEMNGFTNASFATALGEYGQQNISGWKKRGQVGGPTGARVCELLPKTDFAWLQYGIGSPERFTSADVNPSADDVRHSSFLRLDPVTLRRVHTGLSWRFKLELGKDYDLDRDADLFALAYTFDVSGDESDRNAMKAAVDARIASLTGEARGQTEIPSRSTRSGPN